MHLNCLNGSPTHFKPNRSDGSYAAEKHPEHKNHSVTLFYTTSSSTTQDLLRISLSVRSKMQLSGIALALLIGGYNTATAFIETNSTSEFDSFEYVDPELKQVSDWDITERPSINSITGEGGDKG
eukprot:scaffold4251_cov100-Skeletonema_dohrnii-CCMP3373.AAC.2